MDAFLCAGTRHGIADPGRGRRPSLHLPRELGEPGADGIVAVAARFSGQAGGLPRAVRRLPRLQLHGGRLGMSGLVMVRAEPLNCEAPIARLLGGTVMPTQHFYVRNHFAVPALDAESWRLRVRGLVRRPLRLTLSDLLSLPSRVMTVTLECAGNGRAFM